jgi:hypothetical protein
MDSWIARYITTIPSGGWSGSWVLDKLKITLTLLKLAFPCHLKVSFNICLNVFQQSFTDQIALQNVVVIKSYLVTNYMKYDNKSLNPISSGV